MDGLIVYTANFGGRDVVRPESFHQIFPNIRYVYFTDRKPEEKNLNEREVVIEPPKFSSPNKSAKWYKMHPHILFPNKNTLWLDSNYGCSKNEASPLEFLKTFEHMLLWQHYRGCAYKEAIACEHLSDDPVKLKLQMEHYRSEGFPDEFGLWKGGLIFRKPTKIIEKFNELWWNEICNWQIRDQVSLAYVIWKHNIPFKDIHFETKFSVGRRGIHNVHAPR